MKIDIIFCIVCVFLSSLTCSKRVPKLSNPNLKPITLTPSIYTPDPDPPTNLDTYKLAKDLYDKIPKKKFKKYFPGITKIKIEDFEKEIKPTSKLADSLYTSFTNPNDFNIDSYKELEELYNILTKQENHNFFKKITDIIDPKTGHLSIIKDYIEIKEKVIKHLGNKYDKDYITNIFKLAEGIGTEYLKMNPDDFSQLKKQFIYTKKDKSIRISKPTDIIYNLVFSQFKFNQNINLEGIIIKIKDKKYSVKNDDQNELENKIKDIQKYLKLSKEVADKLDIPKEIVCCRSSEELLFNIIYFTNLMDLDQLKTIKTKFTSEDTDTKEINKILNKQIELQKKLEKKYNQELNDIKTKFKKKFSKGIANQGNTCFINAFVHAIMPPELLAQFYAYQEQKEKYLNLLQQYDKIDPLQKETLPVIDFNIQTDYKKQIDNIEGNFIPYLKKLVDMLINESDPVNSDKIKSIAPSSNTSYSLFDWINEVASNHKDSFGKPSKFFTPGGQDSSEQIMEKILNICPIKISQSLNYTISKKKDKSDIKMKQTFFYDIYLQKKQSTTKNELDLFPKDSDENLDYNNFLKNKKNFIINQKSSIKKKYVNVYKLCSNSNVFSFRNISYTIDKNTYNIPIEINHPGDLNKKLTLSSIVSKSGDASGGHYWAYLKYQDKWLKHDDSTTTEININDIVKSEKNNWTWLNYIVEDKTIK